MLSDQTANPILTVGILYKYLMCLKLSVLDGD
jgi:hypothetical protein